MRKELRERLYPQFARMGAALASEKRLELLDLLVQAPRHVEALAAEAEMPVASASQHLRALYAARLVETDRQGTRVVYRIADERVLRLWMALREAAEHQLSEVGAAAREHGPAADPAQLSRDDLAKKLARGKIVLLDVRPAVEFEHGHLPGALSLPLETLGRRVAELPRDRPIVVYCRGRYCEFADRAVAILRRRGLEAVRLEGGLAEWRAEGRPLSAGVA